MSAKDRRPKAGNKHHVANANKRWLAVTIEPDYCQVGDKVIGFYTTATLDNPVTYSPTVRFAGLPAYRAGDMFKGTQGNAGQGIVSGTSGDDGYVKILTGLETFKVNGKPVARHGSQCMINCNAHGEGGALGMLVTLDEPLQSPEDDESEAQEASLADRGRAAALEATKKAATSAILGGDPMAGLTGAVKQQAMGFTFKALMDAQTFLSEQLAEDDAPPEDDTPESAPTGPAEPGVFIRGSTTETPPPEEDTEDGQPDKPSACSDPVGDPVNPMLGTKLLPGETDIALPAPRPFALTRSYLSSNANIGPLGQGWSLSAGMAYLTLTPQACQLHDLQGRVITFGSLAPGQQRRSPSQGLWVRRAGGTNDDAVNAWLGHWATVPETARFDANILLVSDGQMTHLFRPAVSPEAAAEPTAGEDGTTPWRMVQDLDRQGYATHYHWEGDQLSGVEDSAGRHYALVYQSGWPPREGDDGNRLVGVQLRRQADGQPVGQWLVRYVYNHSGDLSGVYQRDGQCARTFEWTHHLLTAHHVPGGVSVTYDWDRYTPDGRVVAQCRAGGTQRRYQYAEGYTHVTDGAGHSQRYHFDGEGLQKRWVGHSRDDGARTLYRHDAAGRLITQRDPLDRETHFTYDGKGRLTTLTDAAGQHWQLAYNGQQPTSLTGPEGLVWKVQHDPRGNPLAVTGADGATTRFAYDDPTLPDRPTTITSPDGSTRQLEWNALGQLSAEIDCSEQRTTYTYDAHDHLASVTNALDETWCFTHDVMGRRLTTQAPDGQRWQYHYDTHGRPAGLTHPNGSSERLSYDDHGRVVRHTDATGGKTHYRYDASERLERLTLANGGTYRFQYDAQDRLIARTDPQGIIQRYTHDKADQLIAQQCGPQRTKLDYDALGQLSARHLPATAHAPASTEHYQWRADGQLAAIHNAGSAVQFVHDAAGRTVGEQQHHLADPATGTADWQWQYQHQLTATGAPQQTTYGDLPALAWHTYGSGHVHGLRLPGAELAFEPDALHREVARRVETPATEHDPLTLTRTYTAQGQLGQQAWHGARAAPHTLDYQYRRDGLLEQRDQQTPQGSQRIRYAYDKTGRLTASQHGDDVQRYALDAAGQRHDATRHERHDAAGNLIERQRPDGSQLHLGYDGAHRLVTLTRTTQHGQTTRAHYRYDALGRRTDKTVHHPDGRTATTHYGWDGDRIVHQATDDQRTTVIHEPGSFVPMVRLDQPQGSNDTQLSAYITDALGTPQQLLGPDGDTRWHAQPDDWAAVQDPHGHTAQPIRFQGQWHDDESGLYYNRHRYYDPDTGRYITQDPIGLAGGLDLYGYVTNPTGMVDPLGLEGLQQCSRGPGKWVTTDVDKRGVRNFFQMLVKRTETLGDTGRLWGSSGKDYQGTVQDVTQTWESLTTTGENALKKSGLTSAEHTYGKTRVVKQTYLEGADPWSADGKSWHWSPAVPNPSFEIKGKKP